MAAAVSISGVRIALVTSWPSISTWRSERIAARRARSATASGDSRSRPECRASHATARYIAPVSTCVYFRRSATTRETVPLPAPDGPSMAITRPLTVLTSTIVPGMRTGGKVAIAALVVTSLVVVLAWPYVRTAAFLLDVAGVEGGIRRWIPVTRFTVTWSDHAVPTRFGPID